MKLNIEIGSQKYPNAINYTIFKYLYLFKIPSIKTRFPIPNHHRILQSNVNFSHSFLNCFLQTKRAPSNLNILNLLSSEKINNPRKHYLHLSILL
ncbi:hypothetical protein V1477_018095 [Vespula maculifrons]|uniref:Uncharacterized protein n=1 Tax=Vespula maculifrons TaxID=7453 RepID=A0ABD2B089_VESMC